MINFRSDATIGFFLALSTAILWGSIPIVMREILPNMDPITLVWYRFIISFIALFTIMGFKKVLPTKNQIFQWRILILLLVATFGLAGNFILFSSALLYISPIVTQVVAQLSSVGLLFASLFLFKDQLYRTQWMGIMVLMFGLLLFFNTSIIELVTKLTDYSKGVLLALVASCVWVIYGLMQKILLKELKSPQILVALYFGCIILLFPFAHITAINNLSTIQLILLLYCGINTVLGYGALAEAMSRWQVSQVSAMITLTPLFTLLFSDLLAFYFPKTFAFPELNLLGYIGACVVVTGAMFVAVGHRIFKHV